MAAGSRIQVNGLSNHGLQRVKVYRLNEEGHWDDNGTGHVSVEYLEQCNSIGLVVISESDHRTSILIHKISKDNSYQRQGDDTIITWTDPEVGTDIALSFQEPRGCNIVWEKMQHIQEAVGPGSPSFRHHSGMIDEFDAVTAAHFDGLTSSGITAAELPDPELSTLPAIAKLLMEASIWQRDALASQFFRQGFVSRLMRAFRTAEDVEEEQCLEAAYIILKSAVLLSDPALLEVLLSNEFLDDFIGALEYEPGIPAALRPQHREFIRSHAKFKEVIPISNPSTRAKIHQTFVVSYLKDVVLPRVLDDASFSMLSSIIAQNNNAILHGLHVEPHYFSELLMKLIEASTKSEEWRDLLGFLQELCSTARQYQQSAQQHALFQQLTNLGLYHAMVKVMETGDEDALLKATDILIADTSHDPLRLRAHLLEDSSLFGLLVEAFLNTRLTDCGVQEQALEVLRILLDVESLEHTPEKDRFVDLFYERYIDRFVESIVAAAENPEGPGAVPANRVGLILELLCFLVTQHGYRIKYYILRSNVAEKVLKLLKRREGWLRLASIRFFRVCLGMKDEFYNRSFIKQGLLEPLIELFIANGDRYNLINSSLLELFEFIKKENMKGLLAALLESTLWPQLERVSYIETFKQMKSKYDQNLDHPTMRDSSTQHESQRVAAAEEQMKQRGERILDVKEEDYFREDDMDEEQLPAENGHPIALALSLPTMLTPLVDYEDEEEGFMFGKAVIKTPGTLKRNPLEGKICADLETKRQRSETSSPAGA